jgi:hypothetical protein
MRNMQRESIDSGLRAKLFVKVANFNHPDHLPVLWQRKLFFLD